MRFAPAGFQALLFLALLEAAEGGGEAVGGGLASSGLFYTHVCGVVLWCVSAGMVDGGLGEQDLLSSWAAVSGNE